MQQLNVELTRIGLELSSGTVGVHQNEAIRRIAEREVFLNSPAEREWRNNLQLGDFVYLEDDAGWGINTHCHRVIKITRTRIHTRGYSVYLHENGSKKLVGKIEWNFWRETGRFARKNGNASFAISSVFSCPLAERGLSEQEYKKRLKERSENSPWREKFGWGSITEQELNEQWQNYYATELENGVIR